MDILYELEINNKVINSLFNLIDNSTSSINNNDLTLNVESENNLLKLTIKNSGSNAVILNSLKLQLFSNSNYKGSSLLLNPKTINEKILSVPLSKISDYEKSTSYLFEGYFDEETSNWTLFGFLGAKASRNIIENSIKKNEFTLRAVYNFISYELKPQEELTLDSLYFEEGHNLFSLFNSYLGKLNVNPLSKDINTISYLENKSAYGVLFTYKVNDSSLLIDNKPVFLKVDKKKLYLVDIRTDEGKKKVFENIRAVLNKVQAIDINGIGQYIGVILQHKLFNVHYELSQLLNEISKQFSGSLFYSDDYPIGLFNEVVKVANKPLILEEKKPLSELTKKHNKNINYDFFIKIMLQKIVLYENVSFAAGNGKIKELMSIIIKNFNLINKTNKNLQEMALDIDSNFAIIPYVERNKVFALSIKGRENMYIAAFNFENKPIKFYCDFNHQKVPMDLDGVTTEIYSDTNYLISEGKLYIRNFPSMDCCLFKKSYESAS